MTKINRTTTDSGVRLDGDLLDLVAPTGTGVTSAQALALAGPLDTFLALIPYELDEYGKIGYRTATNALTHTPAMVYADGHPLAGQPAVADRSGGDYHTRFGGAPMPFIDFDMIPPFALEKMLGALNEIRAAIVSAT